MGELNDFEELQRHLNNIQAIPSMPQMELPAFVTQEASEHLKAISARTRWPSRLLGPKCLLQKGGENYMGWPGAMKLFMKSLHEASLPYLRPVIAEGIDDAEMREMINIHNQARVMVSAVYGQHILAERVLREGLDGEVEEVLKMLPAARRFLHDEVEMAIAYRIGLEDKRVGDALNAQADVFDERIQGRKQGYTTTEAVIETAAVISNILTHPFMQSYMNNAGLEDVVVNGEILYFPRMAFERTRYLDQMLAPIVQEGMQYIQNNEYYQSENEIDFRGERLSSGRGWVAALLNMSKFFHNEFDSNNPYWEELATSGMDYAQLCLFNQMDGGNELEPLIDLATTMLTYYFTMNHMGESEKTDRAWEFQFEQRPWLDHWFSNSMLLFKMQTKLLQDQRGLRPPGSPVSMPTAALYCLDEEEN